MSAIDKAKTAADILKVASDIYDAFANRKARKEADDKERRIKELDAEVERLKKAQTK